MGNKASVVKHKVTKPIREYNLIDRAHKAALKNKEIASPKHPSTQHLIERSIQRKYRKPPPASLFRHSFYSGWIIGNLCFKKIYFVSLILCTNIVHIYFLDLPEQAKADLIRTNPEFSERLRKIFVTSQDVAPLEVRIIFTISKL